MKNLLAIIMISILAISTNVNADTNLEMCKTFVKQAHNYSDTMKNDSGSQKTLSFYREKVVAHCGTVMAKPIYEVNYFTQVSAKSTTGTIESCKASIAMAQSYAESSKYNKSMIIAEAHKVNIVDNCGTLIAKNPSAVCHIDTVASK